MKFLEMGKDMKIKHSVCSPLTKKALHGGTSVFEQIYGEMFYVGTNDQIIQVETLMIKRFHRSNQVSFFLIDPDLSY